jgi:hypothetical protein
MDDETMPNLLPADPGISGPVTERPSRRREIGYRGDDEAFHLPACYQVAQSILHKHAVVRLLGVREQRREGQ